MKKIKRAFKTKRFHSSRQFVEYFPTTKSDNKKAFDNGKSAMFKVFLIIELLVAVSQCGPARIISEQVLRGGRIAGLRNLQHDSQL